jgi:hypothetical protein
VATAAAPNAEAVTIYRELAAASPDRHLPGLAPLTGDALETSRSLAMVPPPSPAISS